MNKKFSYLVITLVAVAGAAFVAGLMSSQQIPTAEAVSALIALGLKAPEASRRVAAIDCTDRPSEDIVRLALKAMVK